jgi:MFS family permease
MTINKLYARTATNALFFMCGVDFATWASRIPDVKEKLHLSDGALGTILLAAPIGSMMALPLAGAIIEKFGSRRITALATCFYLFSMPLIGFANSTFQIMLALFFFGFGGDLLNISMNVQAVGVEKIYQKTIMGSFHGVFSVGFFAGFAIGGLIAKSGIDMFAHLSFFGVLTFLVGQISFQFLLKTDTNPEEPQPLFALPDKTLWIIALISLCGMMGEGAMADWSVLYFKSLPDNKFTFITAASTAFSVMMVLGRFLGDWIADKIGIKSMIFFNSVLYGLGMVIALGFPTPLTVIIGFGVTGLGLSTIVPLAYSVAGHSKTMSPGLALAAITTVGMLGFLLGPVLIGYLSEMSNLRIALSLLLLLAFSSAVLSRFIHEDES